MRRIPCQLYNGGIAMWIAELVETCIEQITRVNVKLNAIVHRRFDAARAEAKEVDRLVSMNSDAS